MIGIIATLKVKDGQNAAFEAVFLELRAGVRANEPGNAMYDLFKSRTDPNTYVVMEQYRSQDALDAHTKSAHYLGAGPKLGPLLDGRPDVQRFDAVG